MFTPDGKKQQREAIYQEQNLQPNATVGLFGKRDLKAKQSYAGFNKKGHCL